MVRFPKVAALGAALFLTAVARAANWTYTGDEAWFAGLDPLPADVDSFNALKKVFFSAENETFNWWYMGLSMPYPTGLPQVPGIKSQTIQAWRTQHISKTRFRADWSEIIILADFNSGQDISHFYNPLSGINATVPNYYYDGPITYYYEKNGSDISIEMLQSGATIKKVVVQAGLYNDRVFFRQVEEKNRGGSDLVSTLMMSATLADVRDCSINNAKADGYYAAYFTGALASIFAYPNSTKGETLILGNVRKGAVDDPLEYPVLFGKYQAHFPEFFYDGAVSPNFTHILTSAGLPA
ncbi:hypothetical protein ColLi_11501 [Colletotrichum liriopes]|uniref:Uncharacterized protein n=1 Tax=Colletotrichum liriopes TaxID=708192 RepID=A0AA37LYN2_9PEZI|nr:hypothetical protein ColLi_11501 [Colletotrichum liriopes]